MLSIVVVVVVTRRTSYGPDGGRGSCTAVELRTVNAPASSFCLSSTFPSSLDAVRRNRKHANRIPPNATMLDHTQKHFSIPPNETRGAGLHTG